MGGVGVPGVGGVGGVRGELLESSSLFLMISSEMVADCRDGSAVSSMKNGCTSSSWDTTVCIFGRRSGTGSTHFIAICNMVTSSPSMFW